MKRLVVLVLTFCIMASEAMAQVGINADRSDPDPSAMLDVKSTNQGLLIPRITAAARNLIPSPAKGLLVYNLDTDQFNFFNGSQWYAVESTLLSASAGTFAPGGGVSVNTTGTVADNSAMLDVSDPARGFRIPGTTPDFIPAPATGLIIYNTATNLLNYYNGSQWITLCAVSTGEGGASGSCASVGLSVKQDTSAAHHSAILDVSAVNKGVLIPRLTGSGRDALLPVTGLVIYNTTSKSIEYYDGSSWTRMNSCTFTCGSSFTVNHVAGSVAPVSKTVTYGTVDGVPGEPSKCWITSNLGADHQASSVNDATEAAAGWYWQFNRKQGYKHDGAARTPGTEWITGITENLDWQPANDPCALELGGGWRIPTLSEWYDVDIAGTWNSWTGPFASALKLHAAGFLHPDNGNLLNRGVGGNYWSSMQYMSSNGYDLDFYSDHSQMYYIGKTFGFSQRCIRNCTNPLQSGAYTDDFESYTAGGTLAAQNSVNWTTWDMAPGTGQDGVITTAASNSPGKSVKIDADGGDTDLLLLLGDRTSGVYELKWMMYVESGKAGYYNLQHFQVPGIEWAYEVYFQSSGGGAMVSGGAVYPFTYPNNAWFEVKQVVDLDADSVTLYVNGLKVYKGLFSLQAWDDGGTNRLGVVDFYGGAVTEETPGYYIDDVSFMPLYRHIPAKNAITWKWDPVPDAKGYKWSMIDRYASATDLGDVHSCTETGLACDTNYTRYLWAWNDCNHSSPIVLTGTTLPCFPCGFPVTVNHVAGDVAPATRTVTYGTVIPVPGEPSKCWITGNLGAVRPAASADEAAEEPAGWYWQFNRKQGFMHDGTVRTPGTEWIAAISENTDWQAAADPCALELGGGWRIPTATEWSNVDAAGNWTDGNGPWNSALKLHAAGYLTPGAGALSGRGSSGRYWSQSQSSPGLGWHLAIGGEAAVLAGDKASGFTLRCLREEPTLIYPLLQVPGSYQGWNPADSATTIAATNAAGVYNGYLWFPSDDTQFKYTLGPSWDVNWGDDGANGTLDPYGANIYAGTAGCYRLHADLNSMTHWLLRTDWSLIGDATLGGWWFDQDMAFDPGRKTWSISFQLTKGSFKFRANHSWDLNYGDDGFNGTLEEYGSNIPVFSNGFYKVTLDLGKPVPVYSVTPEPFPCGMGLPIGHKTGAVAPVDKIVVYGTVTGIPGEPDRCWITSNLGADHQAAAVDDVTEASAGWYWQFNRRQGYRHDGTTLTPAGTWQTEINEDSGWLPVNDPCTIELGTGWRIPTATEYYNADLAGGWTNWSGPWNSALKLHAGGYLSGADGSLTDRGVTGRFWSGTMNDPAAGFYLSFDAGMSDLLTIGKTFGLPLRCVR